MFNFILHMCLCVCVGHMWKSGTTVGVSSPFGQTWVTNISKSILYTYLQGCPFFLFSRFHSFFFLADGTPTFLLPFLLSLSLILIFFPSSFNCDFLKKNFYWEITLSSKVIATRVRLEYRLFSNLLFVHPHPLFLESHCVAQTDLELRILLPQHCWSGIMIVHQNI